LFTKKHKGVEKQDGFNYHYVIPFNGVKAVPPFRATSASRRIPKFPGTDESNFLSQQGWREHPRLTPKIRQ
jgi:hypothetical protein